MDEIEHADMLQDIRNALNTRQLLCLCNSELPEKVAAIQHMLSGDLTTSVQDLNDAYELAHELEFSEANVIFKLLITEFVPSEKRKQFIFSQITKHQQKLVDFSRNFGGRDWRKGIGVVRAV